MRGAWRWRPVVSLASVIGLVSACQGGASDVVGVSGLANANTKITLVAIRSQNQAGAR